VYGRGFDQGRHRTMRIPVGNIIFVTNQSSPSARKSRRYQTQEAQSRRSIVQQLADESRVDCDSLFKLWRITRDPKRRFKQTGRDRTAEKPLISSYGKSSPIIESRLCKGRFAVNGGMDCVWRRRRSINLCLGRMCRYTATRGPPVLKGDSDRENGRKMRGET
jgi:hypothetical protein